MIGYNRIGANIDTKGCFNFAIDLTSIDHDIRSLIGWFYQSYRALLAPLTYIYVGKPQKKALLTNREIQ